MELIEANAEDVPLPDASFDLAISEYGASIWCDPYKWIPEAARLLRPGGELIFLRNSTLCVALRARRAGREGRGEAPAAAVRDAPHGVVRRGRRDRLPASAREVDRAPAWERLRDRGAVGAAGARGGARRTATTTSFPRSGRASGRPRRSGKPASAGERPAGSADRPRLRVAAAASDPRAARPSVQRRLLRGTRSTTRRTPIRWSSCVSTRAGRRGRSGRTRSARCSASTRRSSSTAGRWASRAVRPRRRRCSSGCRAGRTRSCRVSASSRPGWEELHHEVTTVTFRALTARDLAHYVGSGEWEGRAGGYAIQGLGASLVERIEGDYLNVVGLPAALLVRLLVAPLPRHVRPRLTSHVRCQTPDRSRIGRRQRSIARSRPRRRNCSRAIPLGARRDLLSRD